MAMSDIIINTKIYSIPEAQSLRLLLEVRWSFCLEGRGKNPKEPLIFNYLVVFPAMHNFKVPSELGMR